MTEIFRYFQGNIDPLSQSCTSSVKVALHPRWISNTDSVPLNPL